jgi:glutamine amidotransferase
LIVGLLDLGINNLSSVERAFSRFLKTSDSFILIENAEVRVVPELLLLPGLGKFSAGMQALIERGLVEKIREFHDIGTKIVGICLGMQLLGSESEESKGIAGINLIQGKIEKLSLEQAARVPHIGWAETIATNENAKFPSLGTKGDYYFAHSYHFIPCHEKNILTKTPFGNVEFASSIIDGNILGIQFHPEKSGKKGQSLVSEIMAWGRNEN